MGWIPQEPLEKPIPPNIESGKSTLNIAPIVPIENNDTVIVIKIKSDRKVSNIEIYFDTESEDEK